MNTQRYIGYAAIAAGGAGIESFIELWNPATSDKTIKVTSFTVNTKDTLSVLKYHTAQQGSAGTVGTSGNLNLGGIAPAGVLYGHGVASVSGTIISKVNTTADTDKVQCLEDHPIIVKPGQSILLESTTANQAINSVEVCWHEIDQSY